MLFDCLRELYSHLDLQTLPARILSVLPKVVPAEVVAYGALNPSRQQIIVAVEPADIGFPQDEQMIAQDLPKHPLIDRYQLTRDGQAVKISDLLTRQQFHGLALYNDFHRRVGIEDQMMVFLPSPAPSLIGISLSRSQPNFSERDRLLLNLLQPHLTQAYHNAEAVTQMQQALARLGQAAEESGLGVILLNREGQIRLMTGQARRCVANYFGKPRKALRLPEDLWQWVRQQHSLLTQTGEVPPPRVPLAVERKGRQLIVRLLSDPSENQCFLLLEEQKTALSATSLESLGLGQREAEVLFWVAQGKTNFEVGTILGLSDRTVQKHLERVYQKLDVSTRSAATLQALETLGLLEGKPHSRRVNVPVLRKTPQACCSDTT